MPAAAAWLLDTNILLRMSKSDDPRHAVIGGALRALVARGAGRGARGHMTPTWLRACTFTASRNADFQRPGLSMVHRTPHRPPGRVPSPDQTALSAGIPPAPPEVGRAIPARVARAGGTDPRHASQMAVCAEPASARAVLRVGDYTAMWPSRLPFRNNSPQLRPRRNVFISRKTSASSFWNM
jgi:hypothetical protein